jgi:hypothetical protein
VLFVAKDASVRATEFFPKNDFLKWAVFFCLVWVFRGQIFTGEGVAAKCAKAEAGLFSPVRRLCLFSVTHFFTLIERLALDDK